MAKNKREHKLNGEIKAVEIRIEGDIMSLKEGLTMAEDSNKDLVLISSKAKPPVCKIMDYEKFIYIQNKKVKVKTPELKEIKLGPNMSDNDMDYRVKHLIDFLKKGHKVKLSIQFKGREMTHTENGQAIMLKMIVAVEGYGTPESLPKMEGRKMISFVKPNKK